MVDFAAHFKIFISYLSFPPRTCFLTTKLVFLLDFLFQDLGMLSRISLKKNWTLKLSQKASELIN